MTLLGVTAALHDSAAGIGGAFDATLAGLRAVSRSGVRSFEVNVPVLRCNIHALDAIVQLARCMRASGVTFMLPPPAAGEIPNWSDVRAPIVEAAARASRGYVKLQGVPLCLLPEPMGLLRPPPHWLLRQTRRHRAKCAECVECVAHIRCRGVYGSDVDGVYGWRLGVTGN